jgi:hypothetical protein
MFKYLTIIADITWAIVAPKLPNMLPPPEGAGAIGLDCIGAAGGGGARAIAAGGGAALAGGGGELLLGDGEADFLLEYI